ncbi:MAG: CdaR family protein [Armatimonas sp.]
MNWLRRNFGYKLLAFGAAALLYLIASAQQTGLAPVEVFLQPEVANIPDSLVLTRPPKGESVTVMGPSSLIDAFREQPVKATVDARGAQPGVNKLPMTYNVPDSVRGRLQITGPKEIRVEFEAPKEKMMPVEVLYEDAPPAGFKFKPPVVIPKKIKITGRADAVEKVARVIASLDNADEPGAIERTVDVVAQDNRDQRVEGITIEPERVRVQLLLQKTPSSKALVLSAVLTGTPAPGYRVVGYRFSPNSASVIGDQAILEPLSALDIPVSVEGLKATTTRRIALTAPDGTKLAGQNAVNITLEVRALPAVSGTRVMTPTPAPTPKPTNSPTPGTGGQ